MAELLVPILAEADVTRSCLTFLGITCPSYLQFPHPSPYVQERASWPWDLILLIRSTIKWRVALAPQVP